MYARIYRRTLPYSITKYGNFFLRSCTVYLPICLIYPYNWSINFFYKLIWLPMNSSCATLPSYHRIMVCGTGLSKQKLSLNHLLYNLSYIAALCNSSSAVSKQSYEGYYLLTLLQPIALPAGIHTNTTTTINNNGWDSYIKRSDLAIGVYNHKECQTSYMLFFFKSIYWFFTSGL